MCMCVCVCVCVCPLVTSLSVGLHNPAVPSPTTQTQTHTQTHAGTHSALARDSASSATAVSFAFSLLRHVHARRAGLNDHVYTAAWRAGLNSQRRAVCPLRAVGLLHSAWVLGMNMVPDTRGRTHKLIRTHTHTYPGCGAADGPWASPPPCSSPRT